ncbi:hypothetical protein LMG7141_01350 [Ralstonia condita]|jgi:hypothetical protein|uniref:Glycine zipper domain-containing protein n=1 Tax=Ralstonia condita TaxID=3058600 RepID=A0ABN9IHN8_9RALS|nr:hypothetical protein [Ralstonia sp. LMG 7141]CAJ0783121.1 hypothetical protein LMG7141_01350 [Ralstonia sp. LMG 7141]
MSLIVAARFDTFERAECAAQALSAHRFSEEDVSVFFVNPSGQHAAFPIGGDQNADPGAARAHAGAGKGMALGAAIGAVAGVVVLMLLHVAVLFSVVAAGVGAYIGSLAGAMYATRDEPNPEQPPDATLRTRHSGVLLAVRVTPEREADAARILAAAGGMDVEEAAGRWRSGEWVDFDPLRPARLNPKIGQQPA